MNVTPEAGTDETVALQDLDAMTHLMTFAEIDEVFKNTRAFRQDGRRAAWWMIGETLTTLDGDAHFERRRLQSALFRRERLRELEVRVLVPALRAELRDLVAGTKPGEDPRAELLRLVRGALLQVSAQVIGLDGIDRTACDRLHDLAAKIVPGATVQFRRGDHARIQREAKAAVDEFLGDFVRPARERRLKLLAGHKAGRPVADLPNDLITQLLLHPIEAPDGEAVAEREALTYFTASANTTSHGVAHSIRELSRWLERHPEDRPRTADPVFLRRVGSEVLRLYPTSPASIRRVAEDTVLAGSGRRFSAGELVYLDRAAAGRDPALFGPDPDTFDPHRGLARGTKPFGMAFGGGAHVCMGRQLVIGSYVEDQAASDDESNGTLVSVLVELYSAGIEMDPDRPPTWNENTMARFFAAFPVRFTRVRRWLIEADADHG